MDRPEVKMPPAKKITERRESQLARGLDLFVQTLIVLSLVAYSFETLPNLPPELDLWLNRFETISVVVFTIEYLVRVYFASPKSSYIFSFFGLVDLLAVLPFYAGFSVDLRSIRLFRVLRLFRIFKLVRYSAAARRFHLALVIAKEELILFFCVTLILLYVSAVGIYHFESEAQPDKFASVFHSLWWSVTTLTTVGYGDAYPITLGGRIFTFFILMIGLGVISIPAGLLAAALSKARQMEHDAGLDEESSSEEIINEAVNHHSSGTV
jgi:voltage-gated potassium channel